MKIQVISGNPRGINMDGHTIVADVIRNTSALTNLIASLSAIIWPDGHSVHDMKPECAHTNGAWRYEVTVERFPNYDDIVGGGTNTVIDYP